MGSSHTRLVSDDELEDEELYIDEELEGEVDHKEQVFGVLLQDGSSSEEKEELEEKGPDESNSECESTAAGNGKVKDFINCEEESIQVVPSDELFVECRSGSESSHCKPEAFEHNICLLATRATIQLKQLAERVSQATSELKETERSIKLERKNWQGEKKRLQKITFEGPVIELNVGGTKFDTTLTTLCAQEGSMLQSMFSGRYEIPKDSSGRFFIDRDGKLFHFLLNALRDGPGWTPPKKLNDYTMARLIKEAEYFGLELPWTNQMINLKPRIRQ